VFFVSEECLIQVGGSFSGRTEGHQYWFVIFTAENEKILENEKCTVLLKDSQPLFHGDFL